MSITSSWFQLGAIPKDVINGHYNLGLVAFSYAVAVLASFVSLDLLGRLRAEPNNRSKYNWLAGGAVAMGAGIWTVHYIGILALNLPVYIEYNLLWTASSLVIAMIASWLALFVLQMKNFSMIRLFLGGFLIWAGLVSRYYMGMEGMRTYVTIHYLPGCFFLSLFIALIAVQTSLWFALKSGHSANKKSINFSALIMGFAICSMHYLTIQGTVFTPILNFASVSSDYDAIKPNDLAFFIAAFTVLIIGVALTASSYYKQMVAAITNEKKFLNAMLDNLRDGILACDAEGNITVVNQALQKNINANGKLRLTDNLLDLFSLYSMNNEKITKENLPLNRALNGEQIQGIELIVKFKNNVTREVIVDGQQIVGSDGTKLGAVTVIHDVTDLKQTEKLKNEFVSIVSHELRTPLTSIRGSLGLLVSGVMGEFPEKAKKLLEIANSNCERLLLLINDILDIEKIEAGKMNYQLKTIELVNLVKESIDGNKMYAEKFGVSIKLIPPASNMSVVADPDRLMQVLANLISNACKFSPKGEPVTISMKCEKNMVRVSITDKGPGISNEFQARIFQKFSQADSSDTRGKGGTGLGLNISKTIIEKFGGSLSFTSKPNEGACFYFDLPMYFADNSQLNKRCTDWQGEKKRILICEDDEDQSQYLKAMLEAEGFQIDIANTVAAAKKLLALNDYAALLLDLILPDQDGIGFIRELRASEKTTNLHIIVLSVIAQTGRSLLNGDALSVVDWLDKPVDFNTLLASINHIKKKNSTEIPHILHIEDNLDTQHVVGILLEKQAIVSKATNLHEARKMLEKEEYDLVILDLLLPDGNGTEILPLLAKHRLPVLVFSNSQLDENYAKLVEKYLIKSNSSNEMLLKTIKDLLEGIKYV